MKSVHIRSYSGPHFPAFRLNTERYGVSLHIHSECGKMRTRITPNMDTFYAGNKSFCFDFLVRTLFPRYDLFSWRAWFCCWWREQKFNLAGVLLESWRLNGPGLVSIPKWIHTVLNISVWFFEFSLLEVREALPWSLFSCPRLELLDQRSEGPMKYPPSVCFSVCLFIRSFYPETHIEIFWFFALGCHLV